VQVRIVIRAKDEATKIGETLARLGAQTLADRAEVVVVDSGSRDGTADIARAAGARVIEIPAASFSYGGALNTGCEGADTPVLVALSAHAPPPDERWLERLVQPFEDERVACACGYSVAPDGSPLEGRLVQDLALARAHPYWGYSNSAGAFRTELWRARPLVVVDPSFATEHSDHREDGPRAAYERSRNVWRGFSMYLDLDPYGVRDLARDWWTELDGYPSHVRARLGWRRAAKLLGRFSGMRGAPRGAPTSPASTGS
jgi:glycosyltransferase involved in cell wall biosynthesis